MRIPLHGAFRAAFGRDHARRIAEASAALRAAGFLSLEPDLDTPCARFRGRSLRRVAAEGMQDAAFLAAYSCPFEDERGGAADCFLERDMHYLARKHVRAGDRVVEAGARYGTTTSVLGEASGRPVLALEPDGRVLAALRKNCGARAEVLHAFLAARDGEAGRVAPGGYGSGVVPDSAGPARGVTLAALERERGVRFSVLL